MHPYIVQSGRQYLGQTVDTPHSINDGFHAQLIPQHSLLLCSPGLAQGITQHILQHLSAPAWHLQHKANVSMQGMSGATCNITQGHLVAPALLHHRLCRPHLPLSTSKHSFRNMSGVTWASAKACKGTFWLAHCTCSTGARSHEDK